MLFLMLLAGCAPKDKDAVEVVKNVSAAYRDAQPKCLTPVAGGVKVYGDEELQIDVSNAADGYLYIVYQGDNEDVKLQLSNGDSVTYTYKIFKGDMVVPLTLGAGEYNVVVYEGMGNDMYAARFAEKIDIEEVDEYGPYLYPNCYVDFDINSAAVALGKELAQGKSCDLEVIGEVYEYVTKNISYDYDKAQNVESSYVPDVDEILSQKKGICFDYAALMASMLRSQRIPTRLEVGYAGDAYHAWITTYVEDEGWINGIIEFDGIDWTLMDPTFAANSTGKDIEDFIGDGSNYTTKYIY